MSRQTKKPAEQIPLKVKNVNLLPSLFATEPNKKMLDSTLDVMTSKGQMLPFKETYGLRSASNKVDEFFVSETNEVRRESQSNNMLVLQDELDSYLGKVSYLDIDNYFKIKNASLIDGVVLDKNIYSLDLPVNIHRITDYSLFYWLPNDLPWCQIHLEPNNSGAPKFSINNDLLGKTFVTVVDDLTGRSLELQTGMVIYFTGTLPAGEESFLTADEASPVTFYVYGVGDLISLIRTDVIEKRIPRSYLKKRPWDKDNPYVDPPAIKWDTEKWDGSEVISSDPEYVTQEKFSPNANHWQSIDHWYHISTIRAVANFLGAKVEEIALPMAKAKRPIITFYQGVRLYNWPISNKGEVKTLLPYNISKYTGIAYITDQTGYRLENGDKVVFEENSGIYSVSNVTTGATFTLVTNTTNNDGAMIVNKNKFLYHRLIFKNGRWIFAQNKLEPNQTPKFEFYTSDETSLEQLNEVNFQGGVILGFKEGETYDSILQKYIEVSSIDFDLINENSAGSVSPNQIKFFTEVDNAWEYTDSLTGEAKTIRGPYGYKFGSTNIFSFYQNRRGLDFTKQVQDFVYKTESEEVWSASVQPIGDMFDVIHVYYDAKEGLVFYTTTKYGNIKFSSKKGFNRAEALLPLISGREMAFVCHNLPTTLSFYKTDVIDNITRPILLNAPYCVNNNISDGIIYLNLNDSISLDGGTTFIDNEIALENSLLYWRFGNIGGTSKPSYKTAIVKPEYKWRFLQNAHIKDKTNPIYNEYDYIINDEVLYDGSFSGNKEIKATPSLLKKISEGDKITIDSIIDNPVQKTAPISLTSNPLNGELSTINYYSLYQHAVNLKSNGTNSREYIDFETLLQSSLMGGGTFIKHSSPLAKFAITATNLPYDLGDLLIKQGKHYDSFLNKLKLELQNTINNTNYESMDSFELLSLALNEIFITDPDDETFWAHSNMIGWGEKLDNYREIDFEVTGNFNLINPFEPISHRAGKELLLQITYNKKFLIRGQDYELIILPDLPNYYAAIEFSDEFTGKTVNIKQWYSRFKSQIPSSLANIGLTPIYKPEIYLDETYSYETYFLIRHDGSRYYLEEGVDENNYPNNLVERLLYEYELAVWANISHDIRNLDNLEIFKDMPGYFRPKEISFNRALTNFVDETNSWLVENNIYDNQNSNYDVSNGFTFIYQFGTGDSDDTTIVGDWRLIYKYFFDTDRPHTHPWEMLGYTIKPTWWDTYYSWTNTSKRQALETALRTGRINVPTEPPILNIHFARCNSKEELQSFPVDNTGALLAPNDITMAWMYVLPLDENQSWALGNYGPYEQIFASTHRGVAAMAKTRYIQTPNIYVNQNWVPGQQVKNKWGQYIDRTGDFWQQCKIEHDYHRSIVNGETVYTSGIESLYGEFCVLNNKNFKLDVIDKFNNVVVNKEFLLQGFTNKDNVRIQSTSINSQRQTLFIPEETYSVRTVKHYPSKEKFYSAIRIIFDGTNYSIYGFNNEYTYFTGYIPYTDSPTRTIIVGDVRVKEKTSYNKEYTYNVSYGASFSNRFGLYDFIIGYGKYLEDQGFIFDEPEGGDIRDWQLSAKQFIYWSNDLLAPGNYIDLNPAADNLIIQNLGAHLENLEGTNENSGQAVDRDNKPLFGKDLLVNRNDERDRIIIKTRNSSRSVYGIKLTFSYYESVVHLNPISEFNDIYFLPEQSTSKRSFVLGGKKTQGWTGEYFAPGYLLTETSIIPNLDTMAERGRNLLDVEDTLVDPVVREAVKDQFGLSRNIELKQLFLQEDNEIAFKNAITYNKGTIEVFNSLSPLTHRNNSKTSAYEEYMVRTGELGNTENIDYYEFELLSEDLTKDYRDYQVVKFISPGEPETNERILYIKDDSGRWVHKPLNKNLRFNTSTKTYSELKTGGPLLPGDTNYQLDSVEEIDNIFAAYVDLWTIPHYDVESSYKTYDKVRMDGKLYYARTTVSPGTWANNNDKFTEIPEPWLPNIYISNYYRPNPDLSQSGNSIFTPGTWQVLQTIDISLGIEETCPGPTDTSKARVTTQKPHGLKKGEYVVIVNCSSDITVVDGVWLVDSITAPDEFYINTRITDVIKKGKVFLLKPVRFKNIQELNLATGVNAENYGYGWKKKFIPFTNAIGETNYTLDPTPSGYDQTYPIAIIDDGLNLNNPEATYDYGNYKVYSINGTTKTLLKEESLPVDPSDIEHLIIYDYAANKTVAKVELFDPKKLIIPEIFTKDIDVIGRVDPAKYNRTTDEYKSVYTSLAWYEEMVGKRWWDTSTVSFSDYEYGDEMTRSMNWGSTMLNNPAPNIYEWTRSPVPPSKWASLVESKSKINGELVSGEAYVDKSLNAENYHWVEEQEYSNGNVYTTYYFWVKNKNTIPPESKNIRAYTTRQLSSYILNPNAAGIPWWAPISNNSLLLKGIDNYLNNSSTVVQIKKKIKGNEKHQQWTFISEGNTVETIPEWLHVRFRDSISAHIFYKIIGNFTTFSGAIVYKQSDIVKYNNKFYICRIYMTEMANTFDEYDPITNPNGAWFELTDVFEVTGSLIGTWDGYFWDKIYYDYSLDKLWFWKAKNVPDQINLHRYNRLGNSVRPHIQSWFKDTLEARRTFIKKLNDIMINVDITTLENWGETRLNDTEYKIADETADITKYWKYVDFQSENFDSTKAISTVLENESDIYTAGVDIGEYVKINTGIRDYIIYEKNQDQSFSVVYRTKGAIEFDKILYDPISLSTWDSIGNDVYPWDFDLNSVYNAIVDALRYEIFVGKYSKYYSTIICVMFRYVLSEQVNVDWLAKSSTIEPVNLVGQSLTNKDSLQRDEITALTNFYSSVKSYRDKIRGGTVNKTSTDEINTEVSETLVLREYDSDGDLIDTIEIL